MKTKVIILIALLSIICTGCKKHECDKLSWTDYNTVEDVHCNFKYFVDENKAHIGDTLKVYGWLYMIEDSKGYYSKLLINKKELQYCTNKSLLFSYPYILLETTLVPIDSIMPENPYDSLLFITGIINYYEELYIEPTEIIKK